MKKISLLALSTLFLFGCKKELGGNDDLLINVPTNNVITGNITNTITLTPDKEWIIKGYVYVVEGGKIVILPGTTIKSDVVEKGALCVERGGKIDAQGTSSNPIVFTSGKPVGQRSPGDWGGIIILGKAKTNRTTTPTIEGGVGRQYGGNDDDDNSGIMRYVRIEYAGVAAFPNSEINALTLGGVGRGTKIEYVQSVYANDDAFEFFGGTVNVKNLVAYATADDDFDFDFGYTGTVSYSISKRDPLFVDNGDAGNGVECDNDGTGSSATPITHPKMINMTLIGPNDASSLSNHNLGLRWRRSTRFTMENSIVVGWMKGSFSLESDATAQSYKDGVSQFKNNVVKSFDPTQNFISKSSVISSSDVKNKALSDGNVILDTWPLNGVSPIGISQGAVGSVDWLKDWTRFPSKGN
jgi:hypothetical protein